VHQALAEEVHKAARMQRHPKVGIEVAQIRTYLPETPISFLLSQKPQLHSHLSQFRIQILKV